MKRINFKKFKQLREQIVLGAVRLKDYENQFGIRPEVVRDIFENYEEFLKTLESVFNYELCWFELDNDFNLRVFYAWARKEWKI